MAKAKSKKEAAADAPAPAKKKAKAEGVPLAGCVPDQAERLAKAGFDTAEEVLPLNVDVLMEKSGLDKYEASVVKEAVFEVFNPQNAPPSGGGGAA